jgi:hypothetical protein
VNDLRDRRGPKSAAELAVEMADAMLDYHEASRRNWRNMDAHWEKIKKTTAKYRIAKAREKKREQRERGKLL